MKAVKTKIEGVLIVELDIFEDRRGWFAETHNKKKFEDLGITADFVQDNHSFSAGKNTLRGLHLQNKPFTQAKLVRCIKGSVLDVAVDLREKSPTYKEWVSVELSEENKKILFIPRGFAHGFISLTENVEIQYKTDNYYDKQSERTVRFDDPEIGIDWGRSDPVLIERDKNAPFLKDCDIQF